MTLTFDLSSKLFSVFVFVFLEKVFAWPQIGDPRPLTHFKSNAYLDGEKLRRNYVLL